MKNLNIEDHEGKFFLIKNVMSREEAEAYSKHLFENSVAAEYNMRFFRIKDNLVDLFGKNIDSEAITIPTDPDESKTRLFNIIRDCSVFIRENFSLENTLEFKRSFIHIMDKGASMSAHNDDGDAYKGEGKQKHYSAVLVFNDDYEGGNFHFYNLGVTLKPEPGTLIVFRGDEERLHGVDEVTEGYRVSMPIFFRTLESVI
jgi:hypothetical protein